MSSRAPGVKLSFLAPELLFGKRDLAKLRFRSAVNVWIAKQEFRGRGVPEQEFGNEGSWGTFKVRKGLIYSV